MPFCLRKNVELFTAYQLFYDSVKFVYFFATNEEQLAASIVEECGQSE